MAQAFQLVKHKVGAQTFEVLTKKGAVLQFREGKLGWSNVLFADDISLFFSKLVFFSY